MTQTDQHRGFEASAKPHSHFDRLYNSPALLLAVIVLVTFVSETLVMFILGHFGLLDTPLHHFSDSLLLVMILFPVLLLLVFRPVKLHLAQRQQFEDALTAERNKLRSILDTMPAGVCIVNQDHRIAYANTALELEFGPVQSAACFDYFRGQGGACSDCLLDKIRAGHGATREWFAESTGRSYEIFDTPLRNADGSISKLSLVRNITARKQADRELLASREQLRALSGHLQQAREDERTAVSREIHDELGQVLAAVQLGVSSLPKDYPDHQSLIARIAGVEQLVAGAITSVQKLSARLRPAMLDQLGLVEAIESQVGEFKQRSGIDCSHDLLLQGTEVGGEVATALFRICQEALTNVLRHSGATRVTVTLEEKKQRILLTVRDNGCGVTPEQVYGSRSLGLIGMRERAYMLGGRVKIRRGRQGGTLVLAHMPFLPPGGETSFRS